MAQQKVTPSGWEQWTPEKRATLIFIFHDEEILLIEKKRGLGEGKINGPGGKLEAGETFEQAAVRETLEEVGLHVTQLEIAGELHFQMSDSADMTCLVYRTVHFSGDLTETDEAAPFWCSVDAIPYDQMWEDDREWFPYLLNGQYFRGFYRFEGDRMKEANLLV